MLYKLGVDISRLLPPIRKKLSIIDKIFRGHTRREAVITSTYEGNHSPGSLHYANLAVDIRSRDVDYSMVERIVKELRYNLGPDYDVVIKPTHIHIEYDPKEK